MEVVFSHSTSTHVISVPECGGLLNGTSGTIRSPDNNKDGRYDHNADCWWNISVEETNAVEINFVQMELAYSDCQEDIIEVPKHFS